MKTAELDGVLLDYWSARADGLTATILRAGEKLNGIRLDNDTCAALTPGFDDWWQPHHVTWFTVGPIIERERIGTTFGKFGGHWHALVLDGIFVSTTITGPTPLIAAMRAYVRSKFGDEVPDDPRAG
ncbi:MAG TPA: phage protein NinX family protein [Paraburkholderia sp.]